MDDFLALGKFIGELISVERPKRILEISDCGGEYAHIIRAMQARFGISGGVIHRIRAEDAPLSFQGNAYDMICDGEPLNDPESIGEYDVILILDLNEKMDPNRVIALLHTLQHKATKQVLLLTPMDGDEGYRKFHPVLFLGLDFAFAQVPGVKKAVQAYSVFKPRPYSALPMDHVPNGEPIKKLGVAFILSHHSLTGGMKALLQQIRHLTRRGHFVSVYFRSDIAKSAIPPWSDLTEADFSRQIVIPQAHRFSDHITDADVLVLTGIDQAPEFMDSKIPVVLWEQGTEPIFGEFQKVIYSDSLERHHFHALYRLPVYLLAVSEVISKALMGVYRRSGPIFSNGVDTRFYHPGEKDGGIPTILLTGNPAQAFKGFAFAFQVLGMAYESGLQFRVKWAAQVTVIHGQINFPLEVIINPAQQELAGLYRRADILLSTSLYESYSLAPLEAMASGTAVVATDCGGINAYAKHDVNCILCRQGDLSAAVDALKLLIENPQERARLEKAGRETALRHSAENAVETLEKHLSNIVQYDRSLRNQP